MTKRFDFPKLVLAECKGHPEREDAGNILHMILTTPDWHDNNETAVQFMRHVAALAERMAAAPHAHPAIAQQLGVIAKVASC
jgi:hypothetical protein